MIEIPEVNYMITFEDVTSRVFTLNYLQAILVIFLIKSLQVDINARPIVFASETNNRHFIMTVKSCSNLTASSVQLAALMRYRDS